MIVTDEKFQHVINLICDILENDKDRVKELENEVKALNRRVMLLLENALEIKETRQ